MPSTYGRSNVLSKIQHHSGNRQMEATSVEMFRGSRLRGWLKEPCCSHVQARNIGVLGLACITEIADKSSRCYFFVRPQEILISRSSLLSTSIGLHEFNSKHRRRCANSSKTFKEHLPILDSTFFTQSRPSIIPSTAIPKCLPIIPDPRVTEKHLCRPSRSL
jgi:hypothetical protein